MFRVYVIVLSWILVGWDGARTVESSKSSSIKKLISVLKSNETSNKEKTLAIRRIGQLAPEGIEVLPELITLFAHESDEVGNAAYRAVLMYKGKAWRALTRALSSKSQLILRDICGALGQLKIKPNETARALVPLLREKDRVVREAAICALRSTSSPVAIDPLLVALKKEQERRLQCQIMGVLLELRLAGHQKADKALPFITKSLQRPFDLTDILSVTGLPVSTQSTTASILLCWGKPGKEILFDLLFNPKIKIEARKTIARVITQGLYHPQRFELRKEDRKHLERYIPRLPDLLQEKNSRLRELAIEMIGRYGSSAKPLIPQLTNHLRTGSEIEQLLVAQSLCWIDSTNQDYLPILTGSLRSSNPAHQRFAAEILMSIRKHGRKAIPDLIRLTYHEKVVLKVTALRALFHIDSKDKRVLSRARQLRSDPDKEVQELARFYVRAHDSKRSGKEK